MNGRAKIRNMHTTAMASIPAKSPAKADIFAEPLEPSYLGISALLVATGEDKIIGADEVEIFIESTAYPDHTPVI